MTPAEIHQKLVDRFQGKVTGVQLETLDPWVEIAPEGILEVAEYLKFDPDLAFDSLANLSGVDYCEPDPKKVAKYGHEPHIEVVYHLFSFKHRHHIVVKVRLARWKDGQAGQLPEIASVASIWSIADWHERETFDLVGINFTGHPNLKRILCAEDWVGHPLRKDYEFPLEYHGVRVR